MAGPARGRSLRYGAEPTVGTVSGRGLRCGAGLGGGCFQATVRGSQLGCWARKLDQLLQTRARGPSREGPSDGPAGSVPEVVGRGDVCPVLCWPGERGGLLRGLSEPRTRAELGFRKPRGREGTRGSPRDNPGYLRVQPPGFRGGGASGSGAEDSIGSQDVSSPVEAPSSAALSSAALLPLHCLWDKSRKNVGLDKISVSIL